MYQKKLFLYFFIVFALYTAAITLVQYNREAKLKADNLNEVLENYADITFNFIQKNNLPDAEKYESLDSLFNLIGRNNLRITLVGNDGSVLYDSSRKDYMRLENHLFRPEIQDALTTDFGNDIRRSATTGEPYYYFASQYGDLFVRAALDYDLDMQSFLRAGGMFFVVTGILFLIITVIILYISGLFAKTLSRLQNFALQAARNEPIDAEIEFPENELGVISKQIVLIYDKLRKTRDTVSMEKEKIIRHLYISKEGVAIFSPQKEKILSTSMFIQNINYISERPALNPEHVFFTPEFREATAFIDQKLSENGAFLQAERPSHSFFIRKRGKYFAVNVIIFSDRTFEISINDVTTQEQEKAIKQQLTSNIAHELRTPVSSIAAYLETIIDTKDIEEDKRNHFIGKAYNQAKRLAELINDISVLNKIEEHGVSIDSSRINISEIVRDITENLKPVFAEKNISQTVIVPPEVTLIGNHSLIYSIFQNLFENTTKHAGENISVKLHNYFEDENFYYFTYSDTGTGIPEKHIDRIFERFYRVDKGRSRKSGGTGLGLAIVKNAVLFHKGEITAKNREGGGLEFYFHLKKRP